MKLDEYKTMVGEFHKAFQLPVVKSFAEADVKHCPLRVNLIAEEYAEYSKAIERKDLVDALGDLQYVFIGTVLTVGVSPMVADSILPIIKSTGNMPKNLFPAAVIGYLQALEEKVLCYRKLLDRGTQLYYKIERTAWALGIDLLVAVRRIHESNMTKLWTEKEVQSIQDTPDLFTTIPSAGKFIVKRKSDGKVVKSPSYRPVVLDDL